MSEYITFEELRKLGCPDELLMQYFGFTRKQIISLLSEEEIAKFIKELK